MTTQAEEQAEPKVEEATKPRIEDTPEFKAALNSAVSKATSRYQQQASEARKESKALNTKVQALSDQFTQAQLDVEVARLAADGEDSDGRVRKLLQREAVAEKRLREAEERIGVATEYEKKMSMQALHSEYGISVEDLTDFDDIKDMEIAALKYQYQHQSAKNGKIVEEEMKPSKPVDTSEGRSTKGKVPDAVKDPKGFADFYARIKESPAFRR